MKTLITLLAATIIATATLKAQPASKPTMPEPHKSVMVYSEEEEALVYKQGSHISGKEILIESLPGFGKDPIPVEVNQFEKGSYTFKKHPALVLPEYYNVVIIDSLTGEQFDLKSADSYTFDVSRVVPERFLLQMQKTKTRLTAMR
jgi:hypothetical protein